MSDIAEKVYILTWLFLNNCYPPTTLWAEAHQKGWNVLTFKKNIEQFISQAHIQFSYPKSKFAEIIWRDMLKHNLKNTPC